MYELNHQLETENIFYTTNTQRGAKGGIVGAVALAVLAASCGSNGGSPTQPTNPSSVTAQVYNASTGQSKEITIEVPNGSSRASIDAPSLARGLGDVVTNEFAVRMPGSLGSLVDAAGSQANLLPGNYQIFVPATATWNGQSVYECSARIGDVRNPSLNSNKRDFVVGVLNKPGVDPNNLPWYVWTDAINEINRNLEVNGIRYGSIRFEPNAANPDLTVGFANEAPIVDGRSGSAWAEAFKNAYMLSPAYRQGGFFMDYDGPATKDTAMAELFEMIFRVDNICNAPGTRAVIGKAGETGGREWGLTEIGKKLLQRNFTRAR